MGEKRFRLITLAIVSILAVPAFGGCGSQGRPARVSYIIKQGGIAIGSQQVNSFDSWDKFFDNKIKAKEE